MLTSDLLSLLRCPESGSLLRADSDSFVAVETGRRWPVVAGAPNFLDEPVVERSSHVSHPIPETAQRLIDGATGPVLNLSAGGTIEKPAHVVELEWGLYRNTDVSADAHKLPFADNSFAGVICCNAFEHYRDPPKVVSELKRVLKPGAFVYVLTAFNQPIHMVPHHYYNATPFGVRAWFHDFSIKSCRTTPYHNGMLALMWLSNALIWSAEYNGPAPDIRSLTLGEMADAWSAEWPAKIAAAHSRCGALPEHLRDITGAAVELVASLDGEDHSAR